MPTKIRAQLEKSFQEGLHDALDPMNRQDDENPVTTLRSPWLHTHCSFCAHSFRPGDAVAFNEDGQILHNTSLLSCIHGKTADLTDTDQTAQFFKGLHQAWPPPKDAPGIRLTGNHPLLAPPRGGFKRHTCAVCAHTFRPGDTAVICPCRPADPMCMLAIHRDPIRGLNCWSAWNPGIVQQYCPATSRKLTD